MPHPDDPPDEALKSLDQRLGAAEAAQARKVSPDTHAGIAQGYRFVGEVVGGVLGGVGLGWLLDHFVKVTAPWGMIGGLLIGTGVSLFAVANAAATASKKALDAAGPLAAATASEEEDED